MKQHAVAVIALALVALAPSLVAQTPSSRRGASAPSPTQTVNSRRGYTMQIPADAVLDSSRSGWNRLNSFERRVYVIPNTGEFRFTATVASQTIPADAIRRESYAYVDSDSITAAGTAYIRTYYLPTRSVRIEIIPTGIRMRKHIDARATIFDSFRWKPGAMGDALLVPD